MAGTSALGPDILEELLFVDRVRAIFKAAGVQLACWEAYCLSRSNAAALQRLAMRSTRPEEPGGQPDLPVEVLESLRVLRDRGGPIVRKLRQFFPPSAGSSEESERQERAIAILIGSARGREAIARWVADPELHRQDASQRIRAVMAHLEKAPKAAGPAANPAPGARETPRATPELGLPESDPGSPPTPAPALFEEPRISPPPSPADLEASCSEGRVTLRWKPVPGASEYSVERSISTEPSRVTLGTVRDCGYVDPGGVAGSTCVYFVSVSSPVGQGGTPASVDVFLPLPPPAPGNPSAEAGNGRVVLRWDAVPEARAYLVKRKAVSGSEFERLATVQGISFVDDRLENGRSYSYILSAVGPAGEGPGSPPLEATPMEPPGQPQGLEVTAGDSRVSLKWPALPTATTYAVKRARGMGGAYELITRLPETAYVDPAVSNGILYRYVISAVNAGGEGPDSPPVKVTPISPPAAPTGLVVSPGQARVWLNWTAVAGATTYTVKRSPTPGGPYTAIATGLARTTQDDLPPNRGNLYYYVVSATGPGGEGPDSAPIAKALPAPPPAPKGLAASGGNGQVSLAWSPSPGALRYNVKRRMGGGSTFGRIAASSDPSHLDLDVSNGRAYEYVVSAVGPAGEGADSSPVRAEPVAPPPAPSRLAAQAGNGIISLFWDPAPGSHEYRIQRATTNEGLFAEIARLGGGATSYVDADVSNGTAYDYVVVAVNTGGPSPTSVRGRATPMAPPAAPKYLEISAGEGRIQLSWAASPGAFSYRVKRSLLVEGPFAALATVEGTTYADTAVTDQTAYYYSVSAVTAGGEGPDADPVGATPVARPEAPTGLSAESGEGLITLSWKASTRASSYTVKRATSPGGPFTTIAVSQGPTHEDRDVDPRMTYYYSVSAMNPAGRSPATDVVSSKPGSPA
jgi:fibronectin type 3 domain-containing protein